MAHHRIAHPADVPDCFGCKTLGLGYQGLQSRLGPDPVETSMVRGDRDGRRVGTQLEHWDGRRDATVQAPSLHLTTRTQERR